MSVSVLVLEGAKSYRMPLVGGLAAILRRSDHPWRLKQLCAETGATSVQALQALQSLQEAGLVGKVKSALRAAR